MLLRFLRLCFFSRFSEKLQNNLNNVAAQGIRRLRRQLIDFFPSVHIPDLAQLDLCCGKVLNWSPANDDYFFGFEQFRHYSSVQGSRTSQITSESRGWNFSWVLPSRAQSRKISDKKEKSGKFRKKSISSITICKMSGIFPISTWEFIPSSLASVVDRWCTIVTSSFFCAENDEVLGEFCSCLWNTDGGRFARTIIL